MNNEDYAVLMKQAKAGDEEAFASIYQNLYTPIFRYICAKVRDSEQAEDILQLVFLRAFKAKSNWPDDFKSPLAYFYTIARNLITDHYRKQTAITIDADDENEGNFWDRLPDTRDTPLENTIKNNQSLILQTYLSRLPENYRQVLELRFMEDLTNAEIAERIDKTEINVRQLQVRALRKLKVIMESSEMVIK